MEEYVSSISSRGQITLPAEVRQRLGVGPKDKVLIYVEGDDIRIASATSRLAKSYGAVPALDKPLTWKEIEEIAREEHAQEAAREGLD